MLELVEGGELFDRVSYSTQTARRDHCQTLLPDAAGRPLPAPEGNCAVSRMRNPVTVLYVFLCLSYLYALFYHSIVFSKQVND